MSEAQVGSFFAVLSCRHKKVPYADTTKISRLGILAQPIVSLVSGIASPSARNDNADKMSD